MAIAAWDHAVSTGVVGPTKSLRNVSLPTTPSRACNPGPSIPLLVESPTLSSVHNVTASHMTRSHLRNATPVVSSDLPSASDQQTPICPIVQSDGCLATPSSPSSSSSNGRSVGTSQSSCGSATHLTAIISALEELGIESQEPVYVVLRGLSPVILYYLNQFGRPLSPLK